MPAIDSNRIWCGQSLSEAGNLFIPCRIAESSLSSAVSSIHPLNLIDNSVLVLGDFAIEKIYSSEDSEEFTLMGGLAKKC